jgi:transcriptional regulator with XRE-family HTH domain
MLPSIAPAWSPTVGFSSLNQSRCHRVLPFCHFKLSISAHQFMSFNLRRKGMVSIPKSLGEHLKNRRLQLGLTQKKAAAQLGKLRESYERWERDECAPIVSEWPSIISFLGYYPFERKTAADTCLEVRRRKGIAQHVLGADLGIAHQTIRAWEHLRANPEEAQLARLSMIAAQVFVFPEYKP